VLPLPLSHAVTDSISASAEEEEEKLDFDILDCTKWLPEEIAPIKWVGTMTLNKNPTNYFAETEVRHFRFAFDLLC